MPSCDRSSNTSHLSLPNTRTGGVAPATASGRSSCVSSRTSADLPAPLGPRIAVCSPAAIMSVRPSRTGRLSLTTVASSSSRIGSDKLRGQRLACCHVAESDGGADAQGRQQQRHRRPAADSLRDQRHEDASQNGSSRQYPRPDGHNAMAGREKIRGPHILRQPRPDF